MNSRIAGRTIPDSCKGSAEMRPRQTGPSRAFGWLLPQDSQAEECGARLLPCGRDSVFDSCGLVGNADASSISPG